jgi:sirohydrochlorin cobaltochelatase
LQTRYALTVTDRSFHDATLVLVGHGATSNPNSTAPVRQHAAALRARKLFHEVIECFWMVEPHVSRIWPLIHAPTVFVVPITISQGYFTTHVIPKALGLPHPLSLNQPFRARAHNHHVHYCLPLGTHTSMTDALLARAQQIVQDHPHPPLPTPHSTTLFIAGHGTQRDPQSRTTIDHQVKLLQQLRIYASVQPAFMLEQPFIQNCWSHTPSHNLIVVPFFISDGLHVSEDIPALLGADPATVRQRLH